MQPPDSPGGVIRHYIAQRNEDPGLLRALAGAIYVSTPLMGSKFATARIRLLISEWKQLQLDSPYQRDLQQFIRSTIDTKGEIEFKSGRYKLPIWSFVGARDRIVARNSSTLGIDNDQIRTIDKGHRKISKPRRLDSEMVKQARDVIDGITSLRADIRDARENLRRSASPRPPENLVLTEFFLEADANDSWRPIYESVVQSASSPLVHVEDKFIVNSPHSSNLLIAAHRSSDLIARREATKLKVEELRRRYDQGGAHARVIAVGPPPREPSMKALAEMTGMIHQDNQELQMSFGSAEDDAELRVRLLECVGALVRWKHARLDHLNSSRADESLQIDIDPEGY